MREHAIFEREVRLEPHQLETRPEERKTELHSNLIFFGLSFSGAEYFAPSQSSRENYILSDPTESEDTFGHFLWNDNRRWCWLPTVRNQYLTSIKILTVVPASWEFSVPRCAFDQAIQSMQNNHCQLQIPFDIIIRTETAGSITRPDAMRVVNFLLHSHDSRRRHSSHRAQPQEISWPFAR